MEFDENGLPKPGRPLDAWICEHILGLNVVHHAWPCGYVPDGCKLEAAGFFTKEKEPVYARWFDELHPVYLPEHGTWPLEPYDGRPGREELYCHVEPCPFASTSHAYHGVMEAMSIDDTHGDGWEVEDNWAWDKEVHEWRPKTRVTRVKDCEWYTVRIWGDDKSLEERHAHAVCAAAWLAMGGES